LNVDEATLRSRRDRLVVVDDHPAIAARRSMPRPRSTTSSWSRPRPLRSGPDVLAAANLDVVVCDPRLDGQIRPSTCWQIVAGGTGAWVSS
jgi:hypothetical protein